MNICFTQAQVDTAPTFPTAIELWHKWLAGFVGESSALRHRSIFGAWGEYDRQQLQQDSKYHRSDLPYILGRQRIDLD